MDVHKKCIRYNDFLSNVSTTVHQLHQENDFCDVTLVSEDAQMNAHKVILASSSAFFRNILKRNPHPNPLVYLKGVKLIHLQSAIQFMYEGSVTLNQSEVEPFLALGQDLGIKGLAADARKDYNGNFSLDGKGNQGVDSSNSKLQRKGDDRYYEKTSPNGKEATAPSNPNQDAVASLPTHKEDRAKTKNTSLIAESKRHCSTNFQEGHKKKMDEHDTKASSFKDTETGAGVFNQDTNAIQGNDNAGTSGEDSNKEARVKRKTSNENEINVPPFTDKESDVTKSSKRHCSSNIKEDQHWEDDHNTNGSLFVNIKAPVQSIFNQGKIAVEENGNAGTRNVNIEPLREMEEHGDKENKLALGRGEDCFGFGIETEVDQIGSENPPASLLSASKMNQQELRQELLNKLNYTDSDDNHSVYSDYNPPNCVSRLTETDGLAGSENSSHLMPSGSEMNQQELRQELLNQFNVQDNDDNHSLYSQCSRTSGTESLTENEEDIYGAALTQVDDGLWCTVCERLFSRKDSAYRHVQNIHTNNEVFCDKCNTKYKNIRTFAQHKKKCI